MKMGMKLKLVCVCECISTKPINLNHNFLQWLIYLIDLVVDNLLKCFTFPPIQHTVSFKTKRPYVTAVHKLAYLSNKIAFKEAFALKMGPVASAWSAKILFKNRLHMETKV